MYTMYAINKSTTCFGMNPPCCGDATIHAGSSKNKHIIVTRGLFLKRGGGNEEIEEGMRGDRERERRERQRQKGERDRERGETDRERQRKERENREKREKREKAVRKE